MSVPFLQQLFACVLQHCKYQVSSKLVALKSAPFANLMLAQCSKLEALKLQNKNCTVEYIRISGEGLRLQFDLHTKLKFRVLI